MGLTWQDKKAELSKGLLEVVERATELETLLNDNLLRQQQELKQTLGSADVDADRCPHLQLFHALMILLSFSGL